MKNPGFIVAHDSYLLRKGMLSLLHRIPGIGTVFEAEDQESLEILLSEHPGYFLILGQSLFEECEDLFIHYPAILEKTLLLGKEKAPPEMQGTIHPLEPKEGIVRKIKELIRDQFPLPGELSPGELSPRERTIVRLVSLGNTNKQIADMLSLSTHTVMTHRKNISAKLGIKSVSGLTIYAIVNNLISINEVRFKAEE